VTADRTPAGLCTHHGLAACGICDRPGRCDYAGCIADAGIEHVRSHDRPPRQVCQIHGRMLTNEYPGSTLRPLGATEAERCAPQWYCPNCARPCDKNAGISECVCFGTDAPIEKPVHVPGGTTAGLERLASAARRLGAYPAGITADQVKAASTALLVRGPRTELVVDVALSARGWTVTAGPPGHLQGRGFTGFVAHLPECDCDRTPCIKGNCAQHKHCHGGIVGGSEPVWSGAGHTEHVEMFVRHIARQHHGKVTAVPVPRRTPSDGAA
jgi:hypothetical protein